MKHSIPILMMLFINQPSFATDDYSVSLAPKLGLHIGLGMFSNSGTSSNSTSSAQANSIGISAQLFPFSTLSVGAGYLLYFDLSSDTVPVYGLNIFTHYYFYGQGTRILTKASGFSHEATGKLGFYVGAEMTQRNYYSGVSASSQTSSKIVTGTGNYLAAACSLGSDLSLSSTLQLNLEINTSIFTFSTSDDRVRLQTTAVNLGLMYLW